MSDRVSQIKKAWPKGCQPPAGYVDWSEWAEAQDAHGLLQTQCRHCKRYFFPQEADRHAHREEKSL